MTNHPKKSVLIFIAHYIPAFRGGGPIRTIEGMTQEHAGDFNFFVVCSNRDLGQIEPLPVRTGEWITVGNTKVLYADTSTKLSFLRDILALRKLHFDFVYLNSYFSVAFSAIPAAMAKVALLRGQQFIIAPRGEFGPSALNLSKMKKKLYTKVARFLRLHTNFIWHASSAVEASEIAGQYPNSPVVVRENETCLPNFASCENWKPPEKGVRFIYVGRLSPKKRIELAVQALVHSGVTCSFDIYGEFEDRSYEEYIRTLTLSAPSSVVIRFHGPLKHELVRLKFTEADYFLFPTSHENFGHTIAESISAGCPVIIEDVTPFSAVVSDGGGIVVVDSSIISWAEAIKAAEARSDHEHSEARSATAQSYNNWRQRTRKESVFELADNHQFEIRSERTT